MNNTDQPQAGLKGSDFTDLVPPNNAISMINESGESQPQIISEDVLSFFEEKGFLLKFIEQMNEQAENREVSLEKYLDDVNIYMQYLPDYIPNLDDEKTIDDDPLSTVNKEVRLKLEAVLGCQLPHPPPPFSYIDNALYKQKPKGPEAVSSLIFIVARGYNRELKSWSIRIVFLDHDDEPVVEDVPTSLLQRTNDLMALLIERGLRVYGSGRELRDYLLSVNPAKKIESFHRQGLVQDKEGYNYFIFNGEPIGDEDGNLMYMPLSPQSLQITEGESGTLDEWKEHVALPSKDSPMLVFLLSLMFVPIIAKALKRSSFAVSLYSDSSTGKTTGIQVGASTLGPAGDPSKNQPTCISSCRHTNNHMEIVAQRCDSQPMLLDELGTSEGKAIGELLHMLIDGRAKGRMKATGGSSGIPTWFTIPVITAEQSFLAFIREKGGDLRNGHIARVLDIPVSPDTMIISGGSRTQAELADYLKDMSQTYYGTAFKSFAKDFIDAFITVSNWLEVMQAELALLANYYREKVERPHEKRAAEHFASIHYAGKLAVSFGVLPYAEQVIESSIEFAFDAWKEGLSGKDELDYEVEKLRSYMSENLQAFVNPSSDVSAIAHIGYKYKIDGQDYLAMECSTLERQISASITKKRLLTRLLENGLLHRAEEDRYYSKRKVEGKGSLKLYMIKQSILEQ